MGTTALTLWNALGEACSRLAFDILANEAFRSLVLARVIEPTSKADTVRVLVEVGAPVPTVRTLFRALTRCVERDHRAKPSAPCWGHATRGGALGLDPLR